MRWLAPLTLALTALAGACATASPAEASLVVRCDESDGEYPAYLRLSQGEARYWDRDAGAWGENRCEAGRACALTAAAFHSEGGFSLTLDRTSGAAQFNDGGDAWRAVCRPFAGELPRN